MEKVSTGGNDRPRLPVTIDDCGQVGFDSVIWLSPSRNRNPLFLALVIGAEVPNEEEMLPF